MRIGVAIPPISQSDFTVLAEDNVLSEGKPILGAFVGVDFIRENRRVLLLGTVVDFEVVNDLSEYLAVTKNLRTVMDNTQVQRILERKNGLILKCRVVSAFDEIRRLRIPYDTPIRPFVPCNLIDENRVRQLIEGARNRSFFHIGHYYGSKLPHFLHLEDFSNLDEAYHFVLSGLSGSGKSTLAKLLLTGYARNSNMSFFIFDTAGEFARAFRDQDHGRFSMRMASIWERMGRKKPEVLDLDGLSLNTWELLGEFLTKERVFEPLLIKHTENQRRATESLVNMLKEEGVALSGLSERENIVREIVKSDRFLEHVYSTKERREEIRKAVESQQVWQTFWQKILEVANRFKKGRPTVEGLIRRLKDNPGETMILDLSTLNWEETVKYVLIREVVKRLFRIGMESYRQTGKAVFNTLVIVEEAHRLVPPASWVGENEELAETRKILLRALAETRKAGLGWMFISTRISNLDKAVFEEARIKIIGRGLSTGEDANRIREVFGREVLTYYSSLPDPSDPLVEQRQHVFLISGPISVLSRKNPEFVEVFSNPDEFLRINKIGEAG